MPDKLTITIEAQDKAGVVLDSLAKKLEELGKQADATRGKTTDLDSAVKNATATIESLTLKVVAAGTEITRSGSAIAQTGRDIGRSFGTEMIASVSGSLSQLSSLMSGWGANAARAFATGLRSGSADVSGAAYELSDILAGYLQVHSPSKYGPLSVEDPKNWTLRLAKLLGEGLISGKELIEKGVGDLGKIMAQLGAPGTSGLNAVLDNIKTLFGLPSISARFGGNMETGSVLPFDAKSLAKEFEDYKKAQDYQAFYDTVVEFPASGLSFDKWQDQLEQKYSYSDLPKMLEGSAIDKSTGLPAAITKSKWFQSMAPQYSMSQLETIYAPTLTGSLRNNAAWSSMAGNGASDFRVDWSTLGIDDFIAKYGTSMLNSDMWNKVLGNGAFVKYDMNMFRQLVPTDPRTSNHAMYSTEDGKATKSAWELFSDFSNVLTDLKTDSYSFKGVEFGWTPDEITKMAKSLESVFGMKSGAWQIYNDSARTMPLDDMASDQQKLTGRRPLMSELLDLGGDWGTVQYTSRLLLNAQTMDFQKALEKTASGYMNDAIGMRLAEMGTDNKYSLLTNPLWRSANPDATNKLLSDYLEEMAATMSGGGSNLSMASNLNVGSSGSASGMNVQINQEFNIDLGDYEGSISDLVREIAQSAAIEAQQALLDVVQFRGV